MHRIFFRLGPVTVYTYGVFVAVALLISSFLIVRSSKRYGIPPEKAMDLLLWVLIAGVAGSRLLFVAIHWDYYKRHLMEIFWLRTGGMAFHGGLVLGILTGLFLCRRNGILFRSAADLAAPYIALGHAIGRIGCFFNGCCFGRAITTGLGVTFPGETCMRVPVQIYSSLALLALFFALAYLRDKNLPRGFTFCMYLVLYSAFRFIIEFWRGDNPAVLMGMNLPQIISVGVFLLGVLLSAALYVTRKYEKTCFYDPSG